MSMIVVVLVRGVDGKHVSYHSSLVILDVTDSAQLHHSH